MKSHSKRPGSANGSARPRPPFRYALLLLGLALLRPPSVSGETNVVPLLPVETFFKHPEIRSMQLSPDGKFLAAIGDDHGKGLLFGINLETGKRNAIVSNDAYTFRWLTNERLLLWVGGRGAGGLFAINRDGSDPVVLQTPFLLQASNPNFRIQFVSLLLVPKSQPGIMLIERAEWNPRIKREVLHPDVRRINFFTGRSSLEEKNPGNVVSWLADAQGEIRAALAIEKETQKVLYRHDRGQPWQVIHESHLGHKDMMPLVIVPSEDRLWVAAYGEKDTLGVFQFDPIQKKLGECLWQSEKFDVLDCEERPPGHVGAITCETERPQISWFDSRLKAVQDRVDEALPGAFNQPITVSTDGKKLLFRSVSDRSPGDFYLVDAGRNEFGLMGRMANWVHPEQMAFQKPIHYTSRDGLEIQGYLTLPVGRSGTNLPMIVHPHGGPATRDSWRFDPTVQFLANRGYAVLQMNFRGSAGYGLAFEEAGSKQWGGKMQDDIVDGVQWAIDQKFADPHRIAIFGASYGGYAALMGLISTPGIFRCGICYAGVTNLRSLLKRITVRFPEEYGLFERERIGDYREDKEELDAVSPSLHVDAIKAPLLLAYGGKDPVVPIEQARELEKALRKAGKKYEIIIEPDEGHGFTRETNQFKLFRKIEQFLQTNLAPASPE